MAANGSHFTGASAGDMLMPVGFRFRPTEEELVHHYLQMKLEGMDYFVSDVISEINICNHEPRDLPGLSLIKSDDQEWYFFSTYKKKQQKPDRKGDEGRLLEDHWCPKTGQDSSQKNYHVRNSQRTNWVMHEYYIPHTNPNDNQRDLVVCCVKKKLGENVDAANCDEGESSTYNNASDFENQPLLALGVDIEEHFSDWAVAQCGPSYHPGPKKIGGTKNIKAEHTQQQQGMDYFEREKCRMLASALGNDYHELPSAFGANELDEKEMSLQMLSGPPVDSSYSRRQEGVMLYQKQAAFSVDVVPNQLVTDEHSGTRRQLVNDEHSGTHQRTSRPQRESRHINALNVKNASSVDVDAELPQINCIQLAPEEYYNNERTRRRTYPTSALEALSKQKELKQHQSKAKEVAERRAAVDFPPKKTSITESNKEAEVAQGNNAEKGMKQMQNATTTGNWKGCSFISWETSPPLTSPPSAYLFNMVLGVIMFCIFAREAVLYGQWC